MTNKKYMKITCPYCSKKFDWNITDDERKLVFEILIKDKEFMKKLGEEAAKTYLGISSAK
jgi:hypothetical protein